MGALQGPDKIRIVRQMGYPLVSMGANAGMAWESLLQMNFQAWSPLEYVLDGAESEILRLLAECEATEKQMSECRTRLQAVGVGSITLNGREYQQLNMQLQDWRRKLSDVAGVMINPASAQGSGSGYGSIPRVHHG